MEHIPVLTQELYNDIQNWYVTKGELSELKVKEMEDRRRISNALFPNPVEGTNKYSLPADWVLKLTHGLDRKVDEAAFNALRTRFVEAGIAPDLLIDWKPSLRTSEYRKLTDEQRAIFDMCIVTSVSSPQLEIVLPANKKKKG